MGSRKPAGSPKLRSARKQPRRNWEADRERIYDALDKIRFHPVVADYLSSDGVDSVKWYKDAGRILEWLVKRLQPGSRRQ